MIQSQFEILIKLIILLLKDHGQMGHWKRQYKKKSDEVWERELDWNDDYNS